MTGHHHHHRLEEPVVRTGGVTRVVLLVFLGLAAVATLAGVWRLWPDRSDIPDVPAAAEFAAPGVTFPRGDVEHVQPVCKVVPQDTQGGSADTGYQPSEGCGHMSVKLDHAEAGQTTVRVDVPPEVAASGLRAGDRVQLARQPPAQGQPALYSYFGTDRHVPLLWLSIAFALIVVAVARLRGLMALVTLAFGGFVVLQFMLPALLAGEPGLWVALAGSSAIMFVVLYATHGFSIRTSTALAGTLLGVGITAAVGVYAVGDSRLSGVADENGGFLSSFVTGLDFPGLLTCGLILAGLGVLNDVTITQASSVWELRSLAPDATRRHVFARAMSIGRDHIASTIYTIVFAYSGASIVVLLLLQIYHQPVLDLISSEDIAEEIVRTLTSGIGLVLAVPITTAVAAAVAAPARPDRGRRADARDAGDPDEQFWHPRR
jgi:uncharacterized membrane protein